MFTRFRNIAGLLVLAMCCCFCQTLWSQQQPGVVQFVPDEVVACLAMTGQLEANAEGTSLERWLAQPEIQDALANGWDRIKEQMTGPDPEDVSDIVKHLPQLFMKHPWAIWLENTHFEDPKLKLACWLGDLENEIAEGLQKVVERSPEDFVVFEINGQKFFSTDSDGDPTEFGIFEKHLLAATGQGELARLIAARKPDTPKWYQEIQAELPLDRTLGVLTVDVQQLMAAAPKPESESYNAMHFDALQKVVGSFGYQGEETVSRISLHLPQEMPGFWKTFDIDPMQTQDLKGVPDSTHLAVGLKLAPEVIWKIFRESADSANDFESFEQHINETWGIEFEKDVIQSFGNYFYLYQELSMVNPFAAGLMGFRIKSPEAFQEQLDLFAKGFEDATEDYGVDIEDTPDGPLYQILPLDPAMGMGIPGVSFQLVDNELLLGLDPGAISSHKRKASREGGKLSDTPRIQALFNSSSNGGLDRPIGVVYLDMKAVIETIYSVVPMIMGGGMMADDSAMDSFPPLEAVVNGVLPNILAVYRTEKGLQIVERTTLPGLSINASVGAAIMVPSVVRVRHASRQAMSQNNMRQLAIAMHNYESAYLKLPRSCTSDSEGKPLLSWRVQILPFLDEQELYNQFHHDEPWDSPHNQELIAQIPDVFKHPSLNLEEGKTVYLGVNGKNAFFQGDQARSFRDLTDGTSNTLMLVEANQDHAVYWTQPADFNVDDIEDLVAALKGNWRENLIQCTMADASVHALSIEQLSNEKLKAMTTISGGEVINLYGD